MVGIVLGNTPVNRCPQLASCDTSCLPQIIAGVNNSLRGCPAPTTVPLLNPAQPPVVNLHWMHCASSGFNGDGSVYGACQVSYSSCAGRYCHSPSLFYAASWAADGTTPVLGAQCASYPAAAGAPRITYVSGFSAANCSVNYAGTGTVIGIPYGPYSWQVAYYYYVATDPATGAELVNSNVQSFLVLP